MSIKTLDKNLRKYYKLQYKEYKVDENDNGVFAVWCEENGYDTDAVKEDLEMDPDEDEAMMLEFDDEFPYPKNKKKDKITMLQILNECFNSNPNLAQYSGETPECMLYYYCVFQYISN